MDRITRVSIVGMGALGVLYGDFFARTLGLEQVTFLADRDRWNVTGIPRYTVTEEDGNLRSVREMKRTPEDRPSFLYLP